MQKILFLLHYPPPVHGAAMVGSYIRESTEVNDTFDCRYINLGTSKTVEEIGKNSFKKHFRFLSILGKCLKDILLFKPDLVYFTLNSHGVGFYKDSLVALVTRFFGIKVVYHFHNKGVSQNQDKWFDNLLYKLVFNNAQIILLSEYLYADIEKYVSKTQVHLCPNGIPEIPSSIESKYENEDKKPFGILFLSNLIESKGVYVLLEACKILKDKGLDFHCTYVGGEGDISGEEMLKSIKNAGLVEMVGYVGKKYGKEKYEFLSESDVFVFPTYYHNETFGLVNLEAMQFSLPVISTYEGGIPDVVDNGKTGFLIPQMDSTVLAEKIELLMNDSRLRKEMGEFGRKRYEKEFSLERFENRFKNILLDITSKI